MEEEHRKLRKLSQWRLFRAGSWCSVGLCVCVCVYIYIRESGSSCSRLIPPFVLHTDSTNSWHCSQVSPAFIGERICLLVSNGSDSMWSASLPWARRLSPPSLLDEINKAELEIMQKPHHVASYVSVVLQLCAF